MHSYLAFISTAFDDCYGEDEDDFFVLLTGWGELIAGVSCTDLELPALAPQLLDAVASLPLFRSITFVAVISP